MSIAVIVPVLRRPSRVKLVMSNVSHTTTVPHRLLFVASRDDDAEIEALQRAGADFLVIDHQGPGNFAKKTNLGYRKTEEEFVFAGADDLRFHPGWDLAALAKAQDGIGVVGTNDLCNPRVKRGLHSTHSLVRRSYADAFGVIDQPGLIYCEEYPHEWVDDELVETAKSRNAWAFAADSIVEHLHPSCHKAESDELYDAMPQRMRQGRRIFNQRKRLWTGGKPVPVADVSVIVATFGDESWKKTAERAVASVDAQSMQPSEVIEVHGENLAAARNEGARRAKAPWLCFLDADDELHPKFMEAMSKHTHQTALLNPAVQFVMPNGPPRPPKMFRPKDLALGNFVVIGAPMPADLFRAAGGFDPQWRAWEDWALVRRVVALGASIVSVPRAIYRAHWRGDGRNNTVDDPKGLMADISADFEAWKAAR